MIYKGETTRNPPKTLFKFLARVSTTIVAVATAFRVLYWWRQQCKQISNGYLEIFKKNNYPFNCNHSLFVHFFQFDLVLVLLKLQSTNHRNMHCTENLKLIFPDMKLRGLVPNFCIHVSVSDLDIAPPIFFILYKKTHTYPRILYGRTMKDRYIEKENNGYVVF